MTDTARPQTSSTVAKRGENDITSSVETITPEIAREWLEWTAQCIAENTGQRNRPIKSKLIAFLSDEIKGGRWRLNGESIVLDMDDMVIDGQHRLLAIIRSGITVQSVVVRGVDKSLFATIDSGVRRTAADTLACDGNIANPGHIAAMVNGLDRYLNGSKARSNATMVLATARALPSLHPCYNLAQCIYRSRGTIYTSTWVGTAMYMCGRSYGWDAMLAFFKAIEQMAFGDGTSIAAQLDRHLAKNASVPGRETRQIAALSWIIQGWNAHIQRRAKLRFLAGIPCVLPLGKSGKAPDKAFFLSPELPGTELCLD